MRYYIESKWRASMIEQEAIALQEHKNPAWYWDNEIHDLLTDTPKKKRKQHCLMILRWYRLWIIIDLLKLWPKLKFNFFFTIRWTCYFCHSAAEQMQGPISAVAPGTARSSQGIQKIDCLWQVLVLVVVDFV